MAHRRTRTAILACLALLAASPAASREFVGIPDGEFATHYRPQQADMWCWASCVEMALGYEGVVLSQEEIVRRTLGENGGLGGLPEDILRDLNGTYATGTGDAVVVSGTFLRGAPAPAVLYDHLQRRQPAILLYKGPQPAGHVVMLTGMECSREEDGGVRIERLHVFDPYPGGETMSGEGAPADDGADDGAAAGGSSMRKIYELTGSADAMRIPPGRIDGIILVEGATLPR